MAKSVLKRIDYELAKHIDNFAKKNQISFRKASEEIAKLSDLKLKGKKIYKEIKI